MDVYHLPAAVSKYCILLSLNHDIRTLMNKEGRGITISEFPSCASDPGHCAN